MAGTRRDRSSLFAPLTLPGAARASSSKRDENRRPSTLALGRNNISAATMAPIDPNANNKGRARGAGFKKSHKGPPGAGKKRKWVPENKAFDGSLQEGQGFAFKRKQKVRHEYNKILRGQRKGRRGVAPTQTGGYPEHLKHLYLAEEEKLQHEEQANRLRRLRGRTAERGDGPVGSDVTGTETNADEATPKEDRPPLIKKKMKTSSYTRTKQEYSRRQEERERKREVRQDNADGSSPLSNQVQVTQP
ncbi:thyroid transcription factor 1-associated protein 26 homolog [Denticeps clupeoides]|uniref:thyroid transcription factor 1-associated protein 26 homolog n=1 Tax=Denticeps clupeoides TaxID=299321 RepID=UPI0010A35442|nr:thyroid transcription factor 1-associated protein 26 homolog [Denticeps clupeoides]